MQVDIIRELQIEDPDAGERLRKQIDELKMSKLESDFFGDGKVNTTSNGKVNTPSESTNLPPESGNS
jgi:hypothetical protein